MTKSYAVEPLTLGGSLGHLAPIFDGAVAGAFVLPEAVVKAVAAYNIATRAAREAAADHVGRYPTGWDGKLRSEIGQGLARTMLEQGPDAWPKDPAAPVLAAELAEHQVRTLRAVAEVAAGEAERLLEALCRDANVTPALAAAFEEVLEQVRRLPRDTPRTAEAALDAEPGQVMAYRALQGLLARHAVIRAAWAALRVREPSRDGAGIFMDTPIGPDVTPTVGTRPSPAGPSDPTSRLFWLATEAGQGWVPTVGEQNAALEEWAQRAARPGMTVRSHGVSHGVGVR